VAEAGPNTECHFGCGIARRFVKCVVSPEIWRDGARRQQRAILTPFGGEAVVEV